MRKNTRFRKDTRGATAVEFALLLPVLLTFLYGTVEGANYLYTNQKVASAASNVLNLVNQQNSPSVADLNKISGIIGKVLGPDIYNGSQSGVVITAIQRDLIKSNTDVEFPYIAWQHRFGSPPAGTQFRYTPSADKKNNRLNENVLNGFTFFEGDQIIVVELSINYKTSSLTSFTPSFPRTIEFVNFGRPRKGAFAYRPDEK